MEYFVFLFPFPNQVSLSISSVAFAYLFLDRFPFQMHVSVDKGLASARCAAGQQVLAFWSATSIVGSTHVILETFHPKSHYLLLHLNLTTLLFSRVLGFLTGVHIDTGCAGHWDSTSGSFGTSQTSQTSQLSWALSHSIRRWRPPALSLDRFWSC